MQFTKIGDRRIPVLLRGGETVVNFESGANGPQDGGEYNFWSVQGEDDYGPWVCIARAWSHLPPGNRFRRMWREARTCKDVNDRKAYRRICRLMRSALFVRPATPREVSRWFASHRDDMDGAVNDGVLMQGYEWEEIPGLNL